MKYHENAEKSKFDGLMRFDDLNEFERWVSQHSYESFA